MKHDLLVPALKHVDDSDPGGLIGVYLYGSAVTGQLQQDSDVDVLMLTRRSLTDAQRADLVDLLLNLSGWKGHAAHFPVAANRRPIEFTSLVYNDVQALTEAPRLDFQFGEWFRAAFHAGALPQPHIDPDVVVLLATAQHGSRALRGPALEEVLEPVPEALLRGAMLASIPQLLDELPGDERNVLLTLARIIVTLETGDIVAKDVAARTIAPRLAMPDRRILEYARAGYLGETADDWSTHSTRATALAATLAERAYHAHGLQG